MLGKHGAGTRLQRLLLHEPYVPHPLVFNAHLQTVLSSELRSAPVVAYARRVLLASDGEHIVLDEVLGADGKPVPADRPLVVMLHGLSGSSESNYVRHFIAHVQREKGADAYRIIVLHARGAARNNVLSKPCEPPPFVLNTLSIFNEKPIYF